MFKPKELRTMNESPSTEPVLLDVARVRARYGDMPRSTLYRLVQDGKFPKPAYPFGTSKPFWHVDDLKAFEQSHFQQSQRMEAA